MFSKIAIAVVAVVATLGVTMYVIGGGDGNDPTTTAEATYTETEYRWAEGWCSDELGGYFGVPLWKDKRPDGFQECVARMLPEAKAGIDAGLDRQANRAQIAYCLDSEPPRVRNVSDRVWTEYYDGCIASFGLTPMDVLVPVGPDPDER